MQMSPAVIISTSLWIRWFSTRVTYDSVLFLTNWRLWCVNKTYILSHNPSLRTVVVLEQFQKISIVGNIRSINVRLFRPTQRDGFYAWGITSSVPHGKSRSQNLAKPEKPVSPEEEKQDRGSYAKRKLSKRHWLWYVQSWLLRGFLSSTFDVR